jgi:hypothetical protein
MEKVIRASLDRIEGDYAVIYDKDGHKFDVPLEMIEDAKPGMRLRLHIEDAQVKRVEVDRGATYAAKDRISKKYERLRKRKHPRR